MPAIQQAYKNNNNNTNITFSAHDAPLDQPPSDTFSAHDAPLDPHQTHSQPKDWKTK